MEGGLVGLLLTAALVANVPLGMWRRGLRPFSPRWFLSIHASIPLLVTLRFVLGLSIWVIPPEIALAVVGQVVGMRLPGLRRFAFGARKAEVDNF